MLATATSRSEGLRWPVSMVSVVLVTVVAGGCGGGELSLTEYGDEVNEIIADARSEYEAILDDLEGGVLFAEGEALLEYTPADLGALLDRIGELGEGVLDEARAIDPPGPIENLHDTWFEVDDASFTEAQEALADRARTAADWYELSDSPEMAAYRTALEQDKEACAELQATLDDTEERGVFAETPWLPAEFKEIVDVLLGCDSYPENIEDLYRPPARSTP